jgi:hypothetical protein
MNKQDLDAFFRHPFVLAIAGTVLGSIFIPIIAGYAQKSATRAETRIKLAIEIMTTSSSVNATLNKIKTAYESFEVHAVPSTPPIYKDRCKELDATISKLYGDFDSTAWWWPWNIYYQARLLKLIKEDHLNEFARDIDAYSKNLVQTTQLLGRPWNEYLTGDPNPVGKKPVMDEIRKQLGDLQRERDDLAVKMAAELQ